MDPQAFEHFIAHIRAHDPDILRIVDTLEMRYDRVKWAVALSIDLRVLQDLLRRLTLQQQEFFRLHTLM